MKKKLLITIAVIMSIFLASAVTLALSPKKTVQTANSVGISYEQSLKSQKPVVLFFYTTWCSYCERFMPKYKTLSEDYEGKYDFVMVNVEDPKNRGLVEDFSISGFPSIFIIDPSINNRISIYNGIYDDLNKVRLELDRYLRIREMIGK